VYSSGNTVREIGQGGRGGENRINAYRILGGKLKRPGRFGNEDVRCIIISK
jgi:hypothetical protein